MDSKALLLIVNSLASQLNKTSLSQQQGIKEKIKKLYMLALVLEESELVNNLTSKLKCWVRSIFTEQRRILQGASDNLIREMRTDDQEKFFNYLRMTPQMFNDLLEVIRRDIEKQHLVRKPIEPKTRLEITLRYLASGDSMVSLSYAFRVGLNTVSKIIAETCNVIWNNLKNVELAVPNENEWKKISGNFNNKCNFPNCIGAIDGKHVIIEAPPQSGSIYYNYKNSHSLNLLGIVDANSLFTLIDVGAAGRQSDGGVFRRSNIAEALENNTLNIPTASTLPGNNSEIIFPYVFVGDEAFALTNYMMRPYPRRSFLNQTKKVFNYRLSRARRTVECAFGILRGRWRIYSKPINASVSTTIKIVQATICLHNFIIRRELSMAAGERRYLLDDCLDEVSMGLVDIGKTGSNAYTRNASNIRDQFAEYFKGPGSVHWQWEEVLRNNF